MKKASFLALLVVFAGLTPAACGVKRAPAPLYSFPPNEDAGRTPTPTPWAQPARESEAQPPTQKSSEKTR